MKIAVDVRSLTSNRRTGIEEYTINLLNALLEIDNQNQYILFNSGVSNYHNNFDFSGQEYIAKKLKISNRLLNFSYKIFDYPKIDRFLGKVDLFFLPNINLLSLSKECNQIVTFHDLSFERFPQYFSFKRRLWHKFINPKKIAQKSSKIITASEFTKKDLVEIYNIDENKINVIYSGIGKQFKPLDKGDKVFSLVREKYSLPEKFILYLGTIEPRKNILGLIKSFDLLKKKSKGDTSIKLVIAGSNGWLYNDIFKEVVNLKSSKDIVFTGFIEDKDKPYLYNLAEIFVYPSFYEGFGFPPLEAMACGIPTITSNFSSLPEVVENGAMLIDPYNLGEIAFAMMQLIKDETLKNVLIEKGFSQVKKFNWHECAKRTLDVFVKTK